jgi:hypothetical protein
MTHIGTHVYITSTLLFLLFLTLLPILLAGQLAQTLPSGTLTVLCKMLNCQLR